MRVGDELLVVRPDRVHAGALQPLDGGAEPDGFGDRHGAGLELPRHVVPLGSRQPDLANHFAPAQERRHRFEQLPLRPQCADAGGAEHLVSGERHEIGADRPDVDRKVGHALRRIDQHPRSRLVRHPGEVGDRIDGAEHVRDVRHSGELRAAVGEEARIGVAIELAVIVHRNEAQLDAALGRQQLPRHQVRVMLHLGEHHGVAGHQVRARPGVRDQVDRLGRVAGEHDLGGRPGADEAREAPARIFVRGGRLLGDRIDPAMDVGIVAAVVAIHRVQDRFRLLGRGGAVEIDQRALPRLPEDRELSSQRARIERPAGNDGCRSGDRELPGERHVRPLVCVRRVAERQRTPDVQPILRAISWRNCPRTLSSGMRSSTGAKNPSTMRRCASERGSPRAIR